ncbi:MAG: SusD-like protein P2 [Parabacteroides sp.]
MKNIIYIVLLLMVTACSGSFLEIYPETTLNEKNFLNSENEFILLANGCYIPMRNYEKQTHWVIAELSSDNTSFQHNPNDGGAWPREVIDQFQVESSNTIYGDFWNASYNGITRCNKLIYELGRTSILWDNELYKDRCAGEALFLRALYYFNLVRQFGGVPLVLEPIDSKEAVNIKRSSEQEVYDRIVADLLLAGSHFQKAVNVEENGRASYASVMALLGKVYLTLHKYKEAEFSLKSVIDLKKYILLPDYANLFNPSNKDFKETIFSVQYSENSADLANRFIFVFAPWTSGGEVTQRPNIKINQGWHGCNLPTEDLIKAFEPGDKRKDVSIGVWIGKDWDDVVRPISYCAKYKPPVSAPDDRCSDNFPVLRYSDVLLMYAEALNEQGRTVEAIPYVEQVRNRAGLMNSLAGYDKVSLENLIAKERQVEFCFENQRWYDLKRTGKALQVLKEHGIREKAMKSFLSPNSFNMSEYKLLAPIPAEQILINKIEQNPGY